jgi:hypothetical protein
VAAQDQRIEFLFAAQVSGQAELKKLTDAVDSLRKEMEALKAANGGVGAATQQFTRSIGNASSHVQAYQRHLDAQAKAMRNHRQGTQQAGMQINDFVTSVSTGSSPIQAFNQQIGQVGYAMSMMGGTAGKIGNFLAGPWSILVIGASMAIGALVEHFFAAEDASKKAKSAISSLSDSFDLATASATDLEAIDRLLAEANKEVAATAIQAANATAAKAAADANAAQQAINNAKAILTKAQVELTSLKAIAAAQDKLPSNFGKDRVFASMGAGAIIGVQSGEVKTLEQDLAAMERRLQGFAMISRRASAESYALSSAMDVSAKATEKHQQTINNLTNSYASGKITQEQFRKGIDLETSAYKKLQDSMKNVRGRTRTGKSEAEKAAEKELNSIEAFMNKIGKVGIKELPAYQREIAMLEKDFFELSKAGQIATIAPFKAAVESIEMNAYGDMLKEDLKEADRMVKDAMPNMGQLTVSKEMEDIISKAEEMDKSFEEIGNTVSDAFKGMLTGAMSWKDGMRSIIGSVIDQLWKLFVVQKIVGFITGALGGATATPSASTASQSIGMSTPGNFKPLTLRARGGSVANNTPYMVGEQGPELFVPSGNGTIIPNNNMRGGGGGSSFNISVDARGSNDPAAVRAQVQQGILEAAPAIIAAAESRTIAGLRRPRLGGVMQ